MLHSFSSSSISGWEILNSKELLTTITTACYMYLGVNTSTLISCSCSRFTLEILNRLKNVRLFLLLDISGVGGWYPGKKNNLKCLREREGIVLLFSENTIKLSTPLYVGMQITLVYFGV